MEFSQYTGLSEEVIRPQLEEAIAQGYLTECADYWQITEHGKLFFKFAAGAFSGGVNLYCRMRRACTQHPATTHALSQKLLNHPIAPQLFGIFFSSVH